MTGTRPRAVGLLTALVFAATGCAAQTQQAAPARTEGAPVKIAEIHRSATCACCERHADYLADEGYEIRETVHEDIEAAKAELGVPEDLASCHTTVIDGYLFEGHMPTEAIDDVVEAQPEIAGIALPGMPGNAPGMGARGGEPLVVQTIDDGEVFGLYE